MHAMELNNANPDRTAMNIPSIDPESCTGCGLCVRVCPRSILALDRGSAVVLPGECMGCGQCEAVCPAGAVAAPGASNQAEAFENFSGIDKWLPWGKTDLDHLVRLMRSRRSCRAFTDHPVDESQLRDLVRIGVTAPSGTNSQKWTFTIIPDRDSLMAWGERIGDFFHRLNRMADRGWLRTALKLAGKPGLSDYHKNHARSVRRALELWESGGQDLLFHGARAAIVAGSAPGASCPAEDALLATQNILLGAHGLGLGSCLIGYAVEAVRHEPSLKTFLGIPGDESVHAVIALGHPALGYARVAGRRMPVVRTFRA